MLWLSFSFFQNNLQLHKINEDDAAVSLPACLCLPLAVQEEKNHVFIEVKNLLEVWNLYGDEDYIWETLQKCFAAMWM